MNDMHVKILETSELLGFQTPLQLAVFFSTELSAVTQSQCAFKLGECFNLYRPTV